PDVFWKRFDAGEFGKPAKIDEPSARVMQALEGDWTAIAGEQAGKALTQAEIDKENRIVKFKGDVLVMERTAGGKLGTYSGLFTLDAASSHCDWTGTAPDGAPATFLGIYELQGDVLKLCLCQQQAGRAARPTEFRTDSSQPNRSVFFTFKRK